jgi:hypothetical protein
LFVGIVPAKVVYAQDAGGPATRLADLPPEERRQRANDNDWFRAPVQPPPGQAGYGAGAADFPSAEVHDAVVANARAATARAMFRRAETALSAAVRGAVRSFESSAEYRQAVADEQRAYDAYLAARRDALRDVTSDAKYKAMQDLRQNLSGQIAERRQASEEGIDRLVSVRLVSANAAARTPAPDSLVAMAELKMRIGSDARAMERDALEGNDKVRQARADLAAAGTRLAQLRARLDETARTNPDIARARTDLEDARVARVTAETYLKGANLAAGEALDFAWWTHRYDYNRYLYNGYSPYYGYGTYSYYPLGSGFVGMQGRPRR